MFAVESQNELDEWVSAIREAVKEDRMRMNRKKAQTLSGSTSPDNQGPESGDGGSRGRPSQSSYYEPNTSGTSLFLSAIYLIYIFIMIILKGLELEWSNPKSSFWKLQEIIHKNEFKNVHILTKNLSSS